LPFSHNDKLRNFSAKNTISWAGIYHLTGYVVVAENLLTLWFLRRFVLKKAPELL
jgi:hypothetical protein